MKSAHTTQTAHVTNATISIHMMGRTHVPRRPCPHKVLTNICFGKATFLLSISYLGNRLPLCLPRSWQAQLTLLFCLPDFPSCTPDFLHLDFCYFSIFWGYFLLAIAFVLTLKTFVIFLSMAQRSRLKRLQRLKVSLKLFPGSWIEQSTPKRYSWGPIFAKMCFFLPAENTRKGNPHER